MWDGWWVGFEGGADGDGRLSAEERNDAPIGHWGEGKRVDVGSWERSERQSTQLGD
jgi:hypothetical protein